MPAGSVRAGERPEDAALREAREETGLTELFRGRLLVVELHGGGPLTAGRQHLGEVPAELGRSTGDGRSTTSSFYIR